MGETLARHISKAGRRSGSDSTNNSDSDSGGLGPKRGVYPQVVHHVLMPCKFPRRRTAPLLIVQLYLLDASAGYQLRTGSLWEAPMLRVPFVRARCWGPPANLSLLFDTLCRQPQHQRACEVFTTSPIPCYRLKQSGLGRYGLPPWTCRCGRNGSMHKQARGLAP